MTNCSRYELFVLLYRFRVSNLGSKETLQTIYFKIIFSVEKQYNCNIKCCKFSFAFLQCISLRKRLFCEHKTVLIWILKRISRSWFCCIGLELFWRDSRPLTHSKCAWFFQYELSCSISILTSFYLVFSAVVRFSLGWILVGRKR